MYASVGCIHAVLVALTIGDKSIADNFKLIEQNMTIFLMIAFAFSVGLATGIMFLSETYKFATN